MQEKIKSNKLTAAAAIVFLCHCAYIGISYLQVPINSDHANQVLEAADILSGNIFLKGWNLTGVSFYLSELPFYVLGTAICGIGVPAYIAAAALMVIGLSSAGFFLSFPERKTHTLQKVFLYLVLTGFPTFTLLGYLRGHCAIFVYFVLLLLVMDHMRRSPQISFRSGLLLLLLTACGCMSDMQLLIIGVIPILLFCVISFMDSRTAVSRKKDVLTAILLSCGTVLGIIMDKLLMKIGSINKNSFLETRKFADLDALGDKFLLLGKGILNVFRLDLPDSGWSVRSISALLITSACLLLTLACVFVVVRRFLRDRSGDAVSVILSFSLILMTGICFITDIYTSEDSTRYIAYFPFAAGALICRQTGTRNRLSRLLPCMFLFLCVMAVFGHPAVFHRTETPQDRLAVFLEENGLKEGYSDFWNASHTTVSSGQKVRVRAIRVRVPELGRPDHAEMQNWFCKTGWYFEGPVHFIAFDGTGYLHVDEENLTILLGKPDRILDNGEYRVYVYDRDISEDISR